MGRLSIWHRANRDKRAAVSPSVRDNSPIAGAIQPFSAAAVTSSRSCHNQPFSASLTRPLSHTQIMASSGR